jgi:hypothetical protein
MHNNSALRSVTIYFINPTTMTTAQIQVESKGNIGYLWGNKYYPERTDKERKNVVRELVDS